MTLATTHEDARVEEEAHRSANVGRAHPHATRTDGHGEARERFRDDDDETDAGIDSGISRG